MSKSIGYFYHPANNHPTEIFEGFSWPCLFFGIFWYLYKGVFAWALIAFVAAWFSFGISTLIFPFFANKQHQDSLLKKGYLTEKKSE